ncbi:MAG TPA: L,D-transpeptidase [Actinomycetota bacterium]
MTTPRRSLIVLVASLALVGAACASFVMASADDPVVSPASTPQGFVGGPEANGGLTAAVDDGSIDGPQPHELPGPGAWVVRSVAPTMPVWADPSPDPLIRFAVETTNPWDQPIVYPVQRATQIQDGTIWYRVLLGIEPNGSRGWVQAADVTLARATDRIMVDTSTRILRHFHDGRLIHRFRIGIGKPTTPTTPGHFFVWARLQPSDTGGQYGSYLLGLSGFSEVLTEWPGGGRMAIHGTVDPTDRGREVSFGCVRVFNEQMDRLTDVPMGTSVVIRP